VKKGKEKEKKGGAFVRSPTRTEQRQALTAEMVCRARGFGGEDQKNVGSKTTNAKFEKVPVVGKLLKEPEENKQPGNCRKGSTHKPTREREEKRVLGSSQLLTMHA